MKQNTVNPDKILEHMQEDFSDEILNFEDYSTLVKKTGSVKGCESFYVYAQPCKNNNLILEGSFKGLMDIIENQDWAIITAHRGNFTKRENILRNRKLRGILDNKKAGVYQLVGHWMEAPEGMDYEEAKQQGLLTDVTERSYLVPRPKDLTVEEFKELIVSAMEIDGVKQDSIIFHTAGDEYYIINNDGSSFSIGSNITFDKVAQAYSQWVRRMNSPFVFEGVESPAGISGYRLFEHHNIYRIPPNKELKRYETKYS